MIPTANERPEGAKRSTSSPRLRGSLRTFSLTWLTSPLRARVLLPELRELERAEELDLALELHAELLGGTTPRLGHQRDRLGRTRLRGVLDEVRVPGRDLGPTDAMALQAAGFEHPAGRELVLRVLEDAPERALVRRLGSLPPRLEVTDDRLDLARRPGRQTKLDLRDDLPVPELGVPVAQAELVRCAPVCALVVDDQCAVEDRRPVAAVCAGIHPNPAARSPRDRAGELEAPQARAAGAMGRDAVGRPPTRHEQLILHLCLRELPDELQRQPVEAL